MGAAGAAGRKQDRRAKGRKALRFAFVGGICTLLYLLLFVGFELVVASQVANVLALLISAVVNTALNRRITFVLPGWAPLREHAGGLVAFVIGAVLTSVSLALLHHSDRHAPTATELAVLIAASAVATVFRFVLFQQWIFAPALAKSARRSPG
jgi:putative flippase GtrA